MIARRCPEYIQDEWLAAMRKKKEDEAFTTYWQSKGSRQYAGTHEERARLAWDAARASVAQ